MSTIRDVANRANVCVATVSRMLNKPEMVSQSTRKRILAAMEELNYHPNEMARSLSTKRTHIIGVIIPNTSLPLFGALADAIESSCADNGYKLLLCGSRGNADKESSMMAMLLANKVDGIILCASLRNPDAYMNIDLPIVSVDRIIPNIPSVSCDNFKGGVLAARELIDSGCRYPVIVNNVPGTQTTAIMRSKGYKYECERLGYEYREIILTNEQFFDCEFDAITDAMKNPDYPVDGIFITGDTHAANLKRFCARRGLETPRDYKLIGFDGTDLMDYLDLSTISVPIVELGALAVELLIKRIEKQSVPERSLLPASLIRRSSTSKDA